MHLNKIAEKGRFYLGKSEVLIINNTSNSGFLTFDISKELKEVDKDYFALAVVGENYKLIEHQLTSNIENYEITKDEKGNVYLCYYQEGVIYGFDEGGNKILEWEAHDIGEGHVIYDIQYQYPNLLWLAFPTGQTVTQVSISEKKEVFKIGEYTFEDKYEPLSYPESIFVKGKDVFIPNMGNNKLFKLDNETKKLDLIEVFEEKIWQYGENEQGRFVLTDTGIYEIEK